MTDKTISLGFLYFDLMNTYGDVGNVITLKKRLEWRGFDCQVKNLSLRNTLDEFASVDFYFFGGGQDQNQEVVAKDLSSGKGGAIVKKIEACCPALAICGGYQLLGRFYQPCGSKRIEGVGVFDVETKASNKRMIGNLLVRTDQDLGGELVGFENHSGQTFLGRSVKPLGRVVKGFGNSGEDKTEGAVYKNAFGCYLHGPVLPKNPKFADYLVGKILWYKGLDVSLKPLDDEVENKSHRQSVERALKDRI